MSARADDPRILSRRTCGTSLALVDLLGRVEPGAGAAAFERIRARLMDALATAEAGLRERHGAAIAGECTYALCALADEVALREAGPLRDFWKPRSLQLHYFQDNRAGHGFFDRQDRLLAAARALAGQDVAGVKVALATQALALHAGFRGRFADDPQGGPRAIAGRQAAIEAALGPAPAPIPWRIAARSGERRPPPAVGRTPRWIAWASLLFVAALFVQARCALTSMTAEVLEEIARRLPPGAV